jgi:hypothetical protein
VSSTGEDKDGKDKDGKDKDRNGGNGKDGEVLNDSVWQRVLPEKRANADNSSRIL